MARTGTLHITYLETIKPLDGSNMRDTKFLAASLLNNVTQLGISFRLPLPFCHVLDSPYNSHTSALEADDDTQTWLLLGTALTQLKKLRTPQIWLGYYEPCSWSVVNDQAILSCLDPVITIEGLDISNSLPKLHPKYEDEGRHFVEERHMPFYLIRRIRQTRHGRKPGSQHGDEVITQPDFPVTLELITLAAELPNSQVSLLAEIEEEERRQWIRGTDVEA